MNSFMSYGLRAVKKAFLGASWQMCNVISAFLRNIPKKSKSEIAWILRETIEDEDKMQKLAIYLDERRYSKPLKPLNYFVSISGITRAFTRTHWREIRTTNVLERINKELKRRCRVAGLSQQRLALEIGRLQDDGYQR